MKVGDLIKFDCGYTQYQGKLGVIVEEREHGLFIINVNGTTHPYFVDRASMEITSESR
jgi:hypothetical protein